MTLARLLGLVTLGALLLSPALVYGQTLPCMERSEMLSRLKGEFREVPVSSGTVNGRLVEVLTSPEGRTWTLLVTYQGASCIIAAGDDWEVYPVKIGRGS